MSNGLEVKAPLDHGSIFMPHQVDMYPTSGGRGMDMDGATKIATERGRSLSICTYFGQRWSQERHTRYRRGRYYIEGGPDLVHKIRPS